MKRTAGIPTGYHSFLQGVRILARCFTSTLPDALQDHLYVKGQRTWVSFYWRYLLAQVASVETWLATRSHRSNLVKNRRVPSLRREETSRKIGSSRPVTLAGYVSFP